MKENKNLKVAAKKIQDKYRKIRQKRKALTPVEILHKASETLAPSSKKDKKVKDKRALIAAKKISKKYKNLYGRL